MAKEHLLTEQGAFLMLLLIEKHIFKSLHFLHAYLIFDSEESRLSAVETLLSVLCNNPLKQDKAVFCAHIHSPSSYEFVGEHFFYLTARSNKSSYVTKV